MSIVDGNGHPVKNKLGESASSGAFRLLLGSSSVPAPPRALSANCAFSAVRTVEQALEGSFV